MTSPDQRRKRRKNQNWKKTKLRHRKSVPKSRIQMRILRSKWSDQKRRRRMIRRILKRINPLKRPDPKRKRINLLKRPDPRRKRINLLNRPDRVKNRRSERRFWDLRDRNLKKRSRRNRNRSREERFPVTAINRFLSGIKKYFILFCLNLND